MGSNLVDSAVIAMFINIKIGNQSIRKREMAGLLFKPRVSDAHHDFPFFAAFICVQLDFLDYIACSLCRRRRSLELLLVSRLEAVVSINRLLPHSGVLRVGGQPLC